jgi:hypothetical protein
MQFKPAESVLASAAKGILAADLSISGTSFTLQAGQGAAFPASDFSVEINGETIDVGTRTNDTFSSLTRANPVPHNGGARGEPVYHVTSGAAIADAVTAGPGGSQPVAKASVTLVAAQILDLDNTPVQLVAGQAGKVLLPRAITLLYAAGTHPFGGEGELRYYVNPALSWGVAFDDPGHRDYASQVQTLLADATDITDATNTLGALSIVSGAPIMLLSAYSLRGGIVATTSLGSGGTGYAPGDTFQTNGDDGVYTVDTVDGGGAILTYTMTTPSTGIFDDTPGPYNTTTLTGVGADATISFDSFVPGNGTITVVTEYAVLDVPA